MNGSSRLLWRGAVAFLAFAAAFGATYAGRKLLAASAGALRPAAIESGSELVLTYIGLFTCGWCNAPEFPGYLRAVRDSVAERAQERGQRFVFEGLAVDRVAAAGLKHLAKMQGFDQVFAGGGWANLAAFRYVWGTLPGPPATPTLLVSERFVYIPDSLSTGGPYTLSRDRVLARRVGLFEIERWVRDGVPVPRIVESSEGEVPPSPRPR